MAKRSSTIAPPTTARKAPASIIEQAIATYGETVRMGLRDFIKNAWHVVDPKPFLPNWHIDVVSEALEAVSHHQIDKLIINIPPGYAKSLMVSVMYPAWQWGPFAKPETRFLATSYGGGDEAPALRDGAKCRRLIQSDWYQSAWGTVFGLLDDQNSKDFYQNTKHGYRVSTGLDGAASGQRADILLIDDPTKLEDALSLHAIQHAYDVWQNTLRSRITDDNCACVLIMQRLHEADLSGMLLKEDGWTHVRLPALFEKDNKCRVYVGPGLPMLEDPRTVDGEPLHPARAKATEEAQTLQKTDSFLFAGQQQQRPAPREGAIVRTDWLQHWDKLPFLDDVIIVVDCAFKDGEQNSWVVMQAWARREANAFLLDQIREHLDMPGTIEALVAFAARWPKAGAKYVEDKANGTGVVQMLKNKMPGLMTTSDDVDVLKPFCMGSKEAKLQAVAPYFQARNVFLPPVTAIDWHGKVWVPEYIGEITTFPKSLFNDQVDGTSMGVWKLLHAYEAHVPVSEVFANDGTNYSPLAGLFEAAYGTGKEPEQPGISRGGNSKGLSVADMIGGVGPLSNLERDAYG